VRNVAARALQLISQGRLNAEPGSGAELGASLGLNLLGGAGAEAAAATAAEADAPSIADQLAAIVSLLATSPASAHTT
jgi:hypothetical protein